MPWRYGAAVAHAPADGEHTQHTSPEASKPARLALQTGRLDDHRGCVTPRDGLWRLANKLFRARDEHHADAAAERAAELDTLCARWPSRPGDHGHSEALAVTLALVAPFAGRERVLAALAPADAAADALERELAAAPALASPWSPPRPRFPYVYDPDVEQRAPIVAMLDGPRSPKVAEFLRTIRQRDENLAAAIVLGADLDMLDMLDVLDRHATRAARLALADRIERDKRDWIRRAESARSRQRLEGTYYGWHSDNLPPGCLEAARGEVEYHVHVHQSDPADTTERE
jgi:hypothetical protein